LLTGSLSHCFGGQIGGVLAGGRGALRRRDDSQVGRDHRRVGDLARIANLGRLLISRIDRGVLAGGRGALRQSLRGWREVRRRLRLSDGGHGHRPGRRSQDAQIGLERVVRIG